MVGIDNAGLLFSILSRLEGGNLIPQFDDAGVVLLLQLGAYFVQSHQGARSVDVIFGLWQVVSKLSARARIAVYCRMRIMCRKNISPTCRVLFRSGLADQLPGQV